MIKLDEDCKKRLVNALTDRIAIAVSYVDQHGNPHISPYGSVHAHSDDQLALWVRNPIGELIAALARNNKIALLYADLNTRTYYRMYGRGHVATDQGTRDKVFTGMHAFEQGGDPDRKGAAVVIDLDTVAGRNAAGSFSMTRA